MAGDKRSGDERSSNERYTKGTAAKFPEEKVRM